jgi:hypothetical protein
MYRKMMPGETYAIYDPVYKSSCYIGTYDSTSYYFVTFTNVHLGSIFYKKMHFPTNRIFIKL